MRHTPEGSLPRPDHALGVARPQELPRAPPADDGRDHHEDADERERRTEARVARDELGAQNGAE